MPIPLLFIGAGIATGVFGIGKSIKAGVDQSDANETNEVANSIVENATQKIEICRKNCGASIESLGKRKMQILNGSIKEFINEFEKLVNVEEENVNEPDKMLFDKKDFAKGDDDEEFFEEENNHTFLKVILIIIGLSSLFTAIYFILKEYTNIF